MKNAEIDAMTTALVLLRKIYVESEITDDATTYITNDRFPRLHNELLSEIGKIERVIASGINEPSKTNRVKDLQDEMLELSGLPLWRPIETAPKDGTVILLKKAPIRDQVTPAIADGFMANGRWVWPFVHKEPTHWMTIPE